MKRLVSMLVVMSMLLCMPVGFADAFDELYELSSKSQQSSIMSCDISFKLDNTLDFLEAFKIPYMEFVDVYHITKGIFDTSSTINAQVLSNETYDKIDAYFEIVLDLPVQINEDFKVTVWNRFSMWMKIDISDKENPVINYIMKIPYDDKYLVYDLESLDVSEAEVMLSQMDLDKLVEKSKELLKKYSVVEKTADGYVMTISKENCNGYIMDILKLSGESYTDEAVKEIYDQMLVGIETYLNETGIFGDEGIVAKYKVENNSIVSADETLSVSLTIPFENPETYEETIETVEFSLITSYSYTSPEKDFVIEFPEITEENSTVVGSYEEEYTYVPKDYLNLYYDGIGYFSDTEMYVPMNLVLYEIGINHEDIVSDGNLITVTTESDYQGFKSLTIDPNLQITVKDGEEISIPNGVAMYNEAYWISESFLDQILGIEINYADYSYGDTADSVSTEVSILKDLVLKDGEYVYGYESDYEYDEYISPTVNLFSFEENKTVIKNNTHYFEFEHLMNICGATEVSVLGNTETATLYDTAVPYSSITLLGGSNLVNADGNSIKLNNIVLRLNGKLYVPAEFIYDVLNFKINSVSDYSYYLYYDNPEFVYDGPNVFWVSEYDLPYFDGEVFIPLDAFELHSTIDVDDLAPTVEHNGKKYITQGYIKDNYGFIMYNVYSRFNGEQNSFYTEYSFEKAE